MSERDRRFFSGNSLDQAVMLAARHYDLDPEELRYSVLDKRHGFLRIRRSVVIEVDPANPRQATPTATESEPPEAAPPAPPARRSRERREAKAEQRDRPREEKSGEGESGEEKQVERRVERPPQKETTGDKPWWQQGPAEEEEGPEEEPYDAEEEPDDEEPDDEGPYDEGEGAWDDEEEEWEEESAEEEPAEEELRPLRDQLPAASGAMAMAAERAMGLALRFARAEMEMAVLQGDERLEIELWGRDEERVLADDGDLLLALQQLMARLIRGFVGETLPVRVDCANFHERRKREVERLARRIAQRVAERGRGETMEPMAPDERRLVHIALRDDRRVETRSVGRGYYKRVAIEPS